MAEGVAYFLPMLQHFRARQQQQPPGEENGGLGGLDISQSPNGLAAAVSGSGAAVAEVGTGAEAEGAEAGSMMDGWESSGDLDLQPPKISSDTEDFDGCAVSTQVAA